MLSDVQDYRLEMERRRETTHVLIQTTKERNVHRWSSRKVKVAAVEKYEDEIHGWKPEPVKSKMATEKNVVRDEHKAARDMAASVVNRLLIEQCSECKQSTVYEPVCRHIPWDELELKKHRLLDTECKRVPVAMPKDEMEMRRFGYLNTQCQRQVPHSYSISVPIGSSSAASAAEEREKGVVGALLSEHGEEDSWTELEIIHLKMRYPPKTVAPKLEGKEELRPRNRPRSQSSSSPSSASMYSGGSALFSEKSGEDADESSELKFEDTKRWLSSEQTMQGQLGEDEARSELSKGLPPPVVPASKPRSPARVTKRSQKSESKRLPLVRQTEKSKIPSGRTRRVFTLQESQTFKDGSVNLNMTLRVQMKS